ncbi:MAG: nucleoside triphosphate pyrophosphohydrolase [Candidatus Humimicrobiaceae bacterium]
MAIRNLNGQDLKNIDNIDDSNKLFSILLKIMEKLRSPGGCMWDREQSHESLKKNLIEESYEVIEAIEEKNMSELKEELGDLLLQVVFHSQIGKEEGSFNINDVIRLIIKKLYRRHPHVFRGEKVKNSGEVLANWEDIKKKERKEKNNKTDSIFSNIPRILPALHYAFEIQRRAARLGFDWDNPEDVFKKIKEEVGELETEINGSKNNIEGELGDLLFSIVNFSRQKNIDCELSLRNTCKKFIERFDYMEKYAKEHNLDFKSMPLSEKDKLWNIAKENLS